MNIKKLQRLSTIADHANKALAVAQNEFAQTNTKLVIGQIVLVTGYTHTGKKMVVEGITFQKGWCGGVTAHGPVLKKNGQPSSFRGEHLEIAVKLAKVGS